MAREGSKAGDLVPGDKRLGALRGALEHSLTVLDATVAPVVATAGRAAGKVADTVRAAPKLVGRSVGRKPAPAPAKATASSEPIAGYSTMSVAQIRPSLSGLSAEDLRRLRDIEASGKKRKSLLAEIDKLLGS